MAPSGYMFSRPADSPPEGEGSSKKRKTIAPKGTAEPVKAEFTPIPAAPIRYDGFGTPSPAAYSSSSYFGPHGATSSTIGDYGGGAHYDGLASCTFPGVRPSEISFAGMSLTSARLCLPPDIPEAEAQRRRQAMVEEVRRQNMNPPVLPASRVEDLPPKPFVQEFLKFPDGLTREQRLAIEAKNNEIAGEHQRIDRARNNQAAKKSRQARLESLANTRMMLNESVAECWWLRLKVIAMGGDADEWAASVPQSVRDAVVREIEARVQEKNVEALETKKRDESKKRSERAQRRAEEKRAMAGYIVDVNGDMKPAHGS